MGNYFSTLNAGARRVVEEIEYDPQDPDAAIQAVIDRRGLDGFQWRVWWVAASGFFTTSYSIFSVNVISKALDYVYHSDSPLIISLPTLSGTVAGAVLFGFLADRYGRKSVYGLELAIVIVATIGMTTASEGAGSMNVYGWIVFWRLLLGVGLGAEYPLSAIISAEWSSTRSRARMMAAVFLMQSIGQLAAYGFGLAVLVGLSNQLGLAHDETNEEIARPKIDAIWRIIIGIGAFPALISLVLRRTIPETPYYLVEKGRVTDAVAAARRVYAPEVILQPTGQDDISPSQTVSNNSPTEKARDSRTGWWSKTTEYFRDVGKYLAAHSRWRTLLGVMLTWFLLDLAYYGLGLDNPKTIHAIWQAGPSPIDPNRPIYEELQEIIVRNIITILSGTLPGSIIILLAIDYVPRVTWMIWTFIALAVLFAINGGTLFVVFETDRHALTIVLYVLAQVIFNLGPNTMTFILPAELFGTRYRGTFYGLAAAAGKLGAITILPIINYTVHNNEPERKLGDKLAGTLVGFVPAMLLGAFITWVWIPEVQFPRGHYEVVSRDENMSDDGLNDDEEGPTFREKLKLPNRPLAHIAQDPEGGQVIGIRRNLARLFRRTNGGSRASMAESGGAQGSMRVNSLISHHPTHSQAYDGHASGLDTGDLGVRSAGGNNAVFMPLMGTANMEPHPNVARENNYYE
ncbi:major facilitator superfamily domain-containing protein [Nemania sp. NC0429]|nr:major facilitator superfamily domain-containing protein [Nemania sp. NC0429]